MSKTADCVYISISSFSRIFDKHKTHLQVLVTLVMEVVVQVNDVTTIHIKGTSKIVYDSNHKTQLSSSPFPTHIKFYCIRMII